MYEYTLSPGGWFMVLGWPLIFIVSAIVYYFVQLSREKREAFVSKKKDLHT